MSGEGKMYTRCLARAMGAMKYDVVVPGERDLFHGAKHVREWADAMGVRLLASNVRDAADGKAIGDTLRIVRAGGRNFAGWRRGGARIALIGVTRNDFAPDLVRKDGIELRVDPPIDTVRRLVGEARASADAVVVVAHLGREGARQLAESVAGIDLMVIGHGALGLPEAEVAGSTHLVQTMDQGREIGDLTFTAGGGRPFALVSNRVVALDDSIAEDAAMGRLVTACMKEGRSHQPRPGEGGEAGAAGGGGHDAASPEAGGTGEASGGAGGVTGGARVPVSTRVAYVGADACRSCHAEIHASWSRTAHARAFETLVAEGRQDDPAFTRYATTGYGRGNGFRTLQLTPQFTGVQCEECHGPGSSHVARLSAPGAPQVAEAGELARGSGLHVCIRCHYRARDPGFRYDRDLARGSHP